MTRHALIIPAAVAIALGIATPAGAHTPAIYAACVDGRPVGHVDLTNYPAGATVTVNATTVTFTGAYHHSYDLGDPTVAHDFHVVVASPDHIGALNETEHTPPCTTTLTTAPTTSSTTPPLTTPTAPTTVPSSSSTPNTAAPTTTTTEAPATTATSSPTATPSSAASTTTTPTTSSLTSTTTDVAVAPPAPPAPRPPAPNLPATGTDTTLQLGIGATVLAAGIGLATIARRRTA